MTRKEEIKEIAIAFAIDEVKDTCNPASKRGLLYAGFVSGAEWADSHPHWINVEDELPMELEPVLAAFGNHYARVCFYDGGKWYIDAGVMSDEAFGVSHWVPLPAPPTCSEKPNNCEKGGEK